MSTDELWPGGPKFIQDSDAFRVGTDSVLLADFAMFPRARRACDLGCGSGVLSILLALGNLHLFVDGVEIQPEFARVARENVALNSLSDRVSIIDGDFRRFREFLPSGIYDLVVCNPPYYPLHSGKPAKTESAAAAREERLCTLRDVCSCAAYLTRWGGRFCLVHRPERLTDVIYELRRAGLEPKRMRFVHHTAGSPPSLVLVESRLGGRPALKVSPPLILTDESGGDSGEVKRIYHRP